MLALFLGCLGFFCYFLYDVNSVRKIAGWMGTLFVTGSVFLVAGTGILFWSNREAFLSAPSDLVWIAGGVFFLCFLIYTLFLHCLLRQHIYKKVGTGKHIQRECTLCVDIPVFCGLRDFICVWELFGRTAMECCLQ